LSLIIVGNNQPNTTNKVITSNTAFTHMDFAVLVGVAPVAVVVALGDGLVDELVDELVDTSGGAGENPMKFPGVVMLVLTHPVVG